MKKKHWVAYPFAMDRVIQIVLHNQLHGLFRCENNESETPRFFSFFVDDNCGFLDFPKFFEIILQFIVANGLRESAYKYLPEQQIAFFVILGYLLFGQCLLAFNLNYQGKLSTELR